MVNEKIMIQSTHRSTDSKRTSILTTKKNYMQYPFICYLSLSMRRLCLTARIKLNYSQTVAPISKNKEHRKTLLHNLNVHNFKSIYSFETQNCIYSFHQMAHSFHIAIGNFFNDRKIEKFSVNYESKIQILFCNCNRFELITENLMLKKSTKVLLTYSQ